MLEKTARSADEDIHRVNSLLLVLEIFATDKEANWEDVVLCDWVEDFENLHGLWLENKCITNSLVGSIIKAPKPSSGDQRLT
jgi:hypothetical protein